jgi:hypothetical protein
MRTSELDSFVSVHSNSRPQFGSTLVPEMDVIVEGDADDKASNTSDTFRRKFTSGNFATD